MTYAAERFIEKNADRLHGDVKNLLAKSTNPLAAELFREGTRSSGPHNKARRHPSLSAQFKKQVWDKERWSMSRERDGRWRSSREL